MKSDETGSTGYQTVFGFNIHYFFLFQKKSHKSRGMPGLKKTSVA
jgi:hypothetical protein